MRYLPTLLCLVVYKANAFPDSSPLPLEVIFGEPNIAGRASALGFNLVQFPNALTLHGKTYVTVAQITADSYEHGYGTLLFSNDGHGHQWSVASPTKVPDAANFFLPLEDGRLLSVPQVTFMSEFASATRKWDKRSFYATGTLWSFDDTGVPSNDQMSFQRVAFYGAPRDLSVYIDGVRGTLIVEINPDLLDISKAPAHLNPEGWKWHTTVYSESGGADENVWSYVSKDGFNWHYQGTPATNEKYQYPAGSNGPTEANTIQLRGGRLQCMFRVVAGSTPIWQSFSDDLGKTWTHGEPVVSAGNGTVLPQLVMLNNGVTLLSSGRPGIWVYASRTPEDPMSWQKFDVVGNHNRQTDYPMGANPSCEDVNDGCSGYTGLTASSANTAMLCYDQGNVGNTTAKDTMIWCTELFVSS